MGQSVVVVDAFASQPFEGNPAAICVTEGPLDADLMQRIALEMNLSETAFLHTMGESYSLRWFTPKAEVDLCGHATLAAAHVLWESGQLERSRPARFSTRSGELVARAENGKIWLDFPKTPPRTCAEPSRLSSALGVTPSFVGRSASDIMVVVDDEATVRQMTPEMSELARLETRGVIVTSGSEESDVDFVSRFFAPAVGVPEDPVTGSAHCCLGPYWAERLGKARLRAKQVSARGGVVEVEVREERVLLGGTAITTLRGELIW